MTAARRRHGRLRVHGRGPLPGVAHRRAASSTCRCARSWPRLRPGRATAAEAAAARYGWAAVETDWRALLDRDDVQLIDICTPGDSHAEIAIAALEAGKHVLCEKPLANTVAEAEAMAAAAARPQARGVRSMVGFNYRRVPAARAGPRARRRRPGRRRSGTSGPATCRTGSSTREFPLTWRLQREQAGSGALGDLGAHIVDLAQYLTGDS